MAILFAAIIYLIFPVNSLIKTFNYFLFANRLLKRRFVFKKKN